MCICMCPSRREKLNRGYFIPIVHCHTGSHSVNGIINKSSHGDNSVIYSAHRQLTDCFLIFPPKRGLPALRLKFVSMTICDLDVELQFPGGAAASKGWTQQNQHTLCLELNAGPLLLPPLFQFSCLFKQSATDQDRVQHNLLPVLLSGDIAVHGASGVVGTVVKIIVNMNII